MQGIHVELTDAMKTMIREKFGRLLGRNERIIRIHVRLHQDQTMGTERHYTLTSHIEIGGPDLVATAEGTEAYDLIDQVVEKLDLLLDRRHGRRKDKRNHPHDVELESELPKVSGERNAP